MSTTPELEPAAAEFVAATANPPYLYQLGVEGGRKAVDEAQSGGHARPDADIEDLEIPGGPTGTVSLRIVRPTGVEGVLPVVLYTHGAG